MNRRTITMLVLTGCLLMAIPAMATTAGAQTADDTDSIDEAFAFDATLDNETVAVSVTENDTAVENASVTVNETDAGTTDDNGTDVGPTDANGTLQFPLENRTAVEIAVTVDETTHTTTYEVVDGELITQESTEDAQEVPDEAADQVSTLQRLISAFRNGEFEKLGPVISEAAGGGPPANAGNGQDNAPDNAGNGQGNAPENASNGQDNAPDNNSNGQDRGGSNGNADSGGPNSNQGNGGSGDTGGHGNGQGAGGR